MANTDIIVVGCGKRIQFASGQHSAEVLQAGGSAKDSVASYSLQDQFWGYDGVGCVCAVLGELS